MRRLLVMTVLSIVAGCGLVSGLDALHVDSDVDGSFDGGSDVTPLVCDGGCGVELPSGFALVTFSTALPATCPNGATPEPVIADPSVGPSACSCKCTMTTKGACSAGNVELFVGDGGLSTCTNVFTTLSGTPGCHAANFALGSGTRLDNSGPTGVVIDAGACSTSSVADASTLATTPGQLCIPTSCASSEALCNPPAGQQLCVVAPGDVSCPAAFTEKHLIGEKVSVACAQCGPECTIGQESCNTGKLTLYTDTACNTGSQNTTSCFSIGGAMTVKSYDYTMTVSASCTTTQTSSASTTLAGEQTVCCRPTK